MANVRCSLWLIGLVSVCLLAVACDDDDPVQPVNTAPTASFIVDPTEGETGEDISVDASSSRDDEDALGDLQVRWDWEDDGVWDTEYSTTKTAVCRFDSAGTKTIRLEVKDTGGLTSATTEDVEIELRYLPQSSPENCLRNLIESYVERDLDEYLRLFAMDFAFVFSPDDISQDPTIPEQWGLAEERESTRNMLISETVDGIDLAFSQSVADSSGDEFPGTWKSSVSEVELRVYTRTEDGEPLTLKVSDGFGTFYFKAYPGEVAYDGETLWRIWRWEDQPIGLKNGEKSEDRSWGVVKNFYW